MEVNYMHTMYHLSVERELKIKGMPLHAGGKVYNNAYFGIGLGPIFLDNVQCTSSSTKLLECPSRPILSHNCLHSADAGVGCESK